MKVRIGSLVTYSRVNSPQLAAFCIIPSVIPSVIPAHAGIHTPDSVSSTE